MLFYNLFQTFQIFLSESGLLQRLVQHHMSHHILQ